jgi:hypothetical protein
MATRSLGTLTLDLVMKLGGFKQGADKATREFDKFSRDMQARTRNLGRAVMGLGALFAGAISVRAIVQATAEAEAAYAKLNAAVIANGGAAGRTTDQLADMSSELQSLTTYEDEAIQSAQSLLLRFQSIQGVNFDRATATVLDLAAALDQDLGGVAKLLGRALEDPEKGLSRLARAGVIFSDEQTKVIKALVDTGQVAAAQGLILDELEGKFGNAAEAARNNFGGALTGLKNAFGDLLEAKGGVPGAVTAINNLTSILEDPGTKAAFDTVLSGFITGLATVIDLIAQIVGGIQAMRGKGGNEIVNIGIEIDKLKEKRSTISPFVWGGTAELKAINAEIAILEAKERALLKLDQPRTNTKGALQAFAPKTSVAGPAGGGLLVLTPEETELREKILEDLITPQQKYNDQIAELEVLLKKKALTQTQYNEKFKQYREELDKANASEKKSSVSKGANEVEQARTKIEQTIESLNTQRETLGLTEAELLRYSITSGDVADALEKMGSKAGPLREQLLALADATSRDVATDAIRQQTEDLQEQAAVLGLTEQQAFAYSVTQGKIAEQLEAMGPAGEAARVALLEGNNELARRQQLLDQEAERENVFEATRTDAERYALALERLNTLFASSSDSETYGRAIAQQIVGYVEASSAAEAYRLQLVELQKLQLDPEANAAAAGALAETFRDASRKASEAFIDEAKRNSVGIVAAFLKDPFDKGIEGLILDFDQMFRDIAAQAVAARLADKLFEGFDDWISQATSALKQLFSSASASGGSSFLSKLGSGIASFFGGGSAGGLEDIVVTAKRIPGYAQGGYTGDGPAHEIAGVVHRGEVVTSAEKARRPEVRSLLRAIHEAPTTRVLESLRSLLFLGGPGARRVGDPALDEDEPLARILYGAPTTHVEQDVAPQPALQRPTYDVSDVLRDVERMRTLSSVTSTDNERTVRAHSSSDNGVFRDVEQLRTHASQRDVLRDVERLRALSSFTFGSTERDVSTRLSSSDETQRDVLRDVERMRALSSVTANDTRRSASDSHHDQTSDVSTLQRDVLRDVERMRALSSFTFGSTERDASTLAEHLSSRDVATYRTRRDDIATRLSVASNGSSFDKHTSMSEWAQTLRDAASSSSSVFSSFIGYTGDGPKLEPAGVVHKGEWVTTAEKVRQPGVLQLLAAIEHGLSLKDLEKRLPRFSVGGLVGASVPMSMPSMMTPTGEAFNQQVTNVTQNNNFAFASPTSAATQQQIAAAAARGLAAANRRNN